MRHRPPGPTGRFPGLVGFALGGQRLSLLARLTARYGDVVSFSVLGLPFAVLNHPDLVRDVLVTHHRAFHKGLGLERARLLLGDGLLTSEDERHDRQRRLLLPAFHRDRIAAYAATMAAYAQQRSDAWTAGDTMDIAHEMSGLTLAIAGKTLLDAGMEADAETIGVGLTEVLSSFKLALLPFGDRLVRLPIPPAVRFRRGRARLDGVVYRLITARRASGAVGRDVLSMLVAARDVDGDGAGMSDEQVRDEVMTLLLAGHETTANALTWTWYLLARHPDAEAALHAEVDRLGGRPPTADDLPRLPYTRAVLAESMRLFPPAYLVGRRALVPYRVPGTGYELPAGTVVLLSQYLLHRDARFWTDPDRFEPERWTASAEGGRRHQYAYVPFGAGPRVCIGEHFAWMEGTLALAAIAQRWRLALVPGQQVEPEPIITLRAKGGIRMTPERRGRPTRVD